MSDASSDSSWANRVGWNNRHPQDRRVPNVPDEACVRIPQTYLDHILDGHSTLLTQLSTLQEKHNEICAAHSSLQVDYEILEAKKEKLLAENEEQRVTHSDLLDDYEDLERQSATVLAQNRALVGARAALIAANDKVTKEHEACVSKKRYQVRLEVLVKAIRKMTEVWSYQSGGNDCIAWWQKETTLDEMKPMIKKKSTTEEHYHQQIAWLQVAMQIKEKPKPASIDPRKVDLQIKEQHKPASIYPQNSEKTSGISKKAPSAEEEKKEARDPEMGSDQEQKVANDPKKSANTGPAADRTIPPTISRYVPPNAAYLVQEKNTGDNCFRVVLMKGLPDDLDYDTLSSMIRGGPVEKLTIFKKPNTQAEILFCNERDAKAYMAWFKGGDQVTIGGSNVHAELHPVRPMDHWRAKHVYTIPRYGSNGPTRRVLLIRSPKRKMVITVESMIEAVRSTKYHGLQTCEKVMPLANGFTRVVFTGFATAAGVRKKLATQGWWIRYAVDECEGTISELGGQRNFGKK